MRDGRTCILSSVYRDAALGFSVKWTMTMRVTGVSRESDGTHFVWRQTTAVTTTGANGASPQRSVAYQPYLLALPGRHRIGLLGWACSQWQHTGGFIPMAEISRRSICGAAVGSAPCSWPGLGPDQ